MFNGIQHIKRVGMLGGLVLALIVGMVPAQPAAARPLAEQARPALSGPAYSYATTHFVIHYTYVGVDAVPTADSDNDDTPDWVEDVGSALETIWRVEIDQLGWPAPLPDNGEGGDTRFDVYLMELFSQGLGGYVSPDGGVVGDNPNTPRTEQQAAFGFMVLDNDYIDPNPPAGLLVWPPHDWMRIIAAHEFNHMLQIAINGNHAMRWFYEATANWMETQVFPGLPDNLASAEAVFSSPDTCMLRYGGVQRVESGLHWYGMWLFDQVLAEEYGARLILDIWYRMADSDGFAPFDDAFAARGTTFGEVLRQFALAVLLRDFRDGSMYPITRLEASITEPGTISPANGVQRYAMEYIGLVLRDRVTVTLDSSDTGIEGIVVGVSGNRANIYPAGRETTVDLSQYDNAYLVVINQTRPPNEAGCATSRYSVTVAAAVGALTPVDDQMAAAAFVAPVVTAPTDPEDIPMLSPFAQTEYNVRDEIRTVDLPFTPITPRGAPDGYELDSVYGLNADEMDDEFRALNAPAGGTVVQILYYNDAGQLIRITESPTIYVTIGEWLAVNRLEFKPGTEIWTTGSVDTAIIDHNGDDLIAFIVQERFMTIDGDADREDMLDMARRFASSFGAQQELPEPRWPGRENYGNVRP